MAVVSDRYWEWAEQAACKGMDTDLFFPEGKGQKPDPQAVAACNRCPVAEQCHSHALRFGEVGLWSTLPGTRRAERRRRGMPDRSFQWVQVERRDEANHYRRSVR